MDYVTRISMSLDPDLLEKFDKSISEKGYTTRSKAICDLIRDFVSENELKYSNVKMTGVIVLIYDGSAKEALFKISEVFDVHSDLILSTTTVALGNGKKMIVIVADGILSKLRMLSSDAASVKGVLRCRMTMVSPRTGNLHHIGPRE